MSPLDRPLRRLAPLALAVLLAAGAAACSSDAGSGSDGDIGDHFPPTDPRWKGAASDQFLAHAVERLHARGGRLVNVDVTLICERPKVKPHRQAMRERLAELLALPLDAVSVKATTTERLGFTGRGEGIAAQAVASIRMEDRS